jgi:hypothetical protein
VLKHARAGRVELKLSYDEDEIGLQVRDEGLASVDGAASGHGMRECATIYGGVPNAGPVADGGFMVSARLPTDLR